jgi:hypothetical protein
LVVVGSVGIEWTASKHEDSSSSPGRAQLMR